MYYFEPIIIRSLPISPVTWPVERSLLHSSQEAKGLISQELVLFFQPTGSHIAGVSWWHYLSRDPGPQALTFCSLSSVASLDP